MLVTGAAGFLGQHLVRGAPGETWEIIAPTSRAMDICNRAETIEAIREWKPDVVAHLAYRKDRRTIVDGTRHVAEGAAACGARLIHVSTDAVFGGRPTPYTEADNPHPVIEYGTHKLDAERLVTSLCPDAVIIRTSLLYGTDRLSAPQTQLSDALSRNGTPMTFFTDEYRTPVHAGDVAAAISTLAAKRDFTGIVHVSGPERLSRIDLARAMAAHLGLPSNSLATSTIAESGMIRAGHVVLDTTLATTLGLTCRPVSATLIPAGSAPA